MFIERKGIHPTWRMRVPGNIHLMVSQCFTFINASLYRQGGSVCVCVCRWKMF